MFLNLLDKTSNLLWIRRQISHKFNKLDQFSHMPTKVHVIRVHKLEHKIQAKCIHKMIYMPKHLRKYV